MFTPNDLVSDVLSTYPEAWAIFEKHGICEDCKKSPPPVPIHHFVDKHCEGKIEEFLIELNKVL